MLWMGLLWIYLYIYIYISPLIRIDRWVALYLFDFHLLCGATVVSVILDLYILHYAHYTTIFNIREKGSELCSDSNRRS